MSSILKLLRVLSRDPTLSLSYEQSERDPDNFGIYASTHLMQTCSSSTTHPTHLVHGLNTVAGPYTHPSGLLDMSSADWYISSAIKVEWASLTVKVELACSAMLAGPACSIVNMERVSNSATVHPATVLYATMHPATEHATEHPATMHPATEHPATEHATEHPATEHATEHPATVHSASEHLATVQLATMLSTTVQSAIMPFSVANVHFNQGHNLKTLKNITSWSPTTHMVISDTKTNVLVYFDMSRSKSVISSQLVHQLGLKTRLDSSHRIKCASRVQVETLDGFFISKKCNPILQRHCKGYDLILGQDFLHQNDISVDYIHQVCRYGTLAYDIISGTPIPTLILETLETMTEPHPAPDIVESEDFYYRFVEQLRDHLLRQAQDIAPFCEQTHGLQPVWTLAAIRRRIAYLSSKKVYVSMPLRIRRMARSHVIASTKGQGHISRRTPSAVFPPSKASTPTGDSSKQQHMASHKCRAKMLRS